MNNQTFTSVEQIKNAVLTGETINCDKYGKTYTVRFNGVGDWVLITASGVEVFYLTTFWDNNALRLPWELNDFYFKGEQ